MSMNLQGEAVSGFPAAAAARYSPSLMPLVQPQKLTPAPKVDTRLDVPLSELTFRHLRSADEIAGIVHLRKEIQLVAASGADPSFVAREKKETKRAL